LPSPFIPVQWGFISFEDCRGRRFHCSSPFCEFLFLHAVQVVLESVQVSGPESSDFERGFHVSNSPNCTGSACLKLFGVLCDQLLPPGCLHRLTTNDRADGSSP